MSTGRMPLKPADQSRSGRSHAHAVPALLTKLSRAWAAWQTQRQVRHIPVVEEYEPRLLYSADLATVGLALAGPGQVVEQRIVNDSGEFIQSSSTQAQAQERRRELLIIGAGVDDSKTLLDGLRSDGREIEVLVLDPSRDSILQISEALSGRHDLSAIHILSHGANGQLQLGATTLDESQLAVRADEIGRWGLALTADGDILLYGCDVAAEPSGAAFVQHLSALTGADVAASNDITGDGRKQGDWILEYAAGHVETSVAFNAAAQLQWAGTLDARVNSTRSGIQSNAAVAINAAGNFVVTWTSEGDLDGDGSGIFMQRYDAPGNRLGGEVQVNTDYLREQVTASVGMDANGGFVVAWASNNPTGADDKGWSIHAQRFNADGSKAGGEFVVNQGVKGDQEQPVIAVAPDGQFVIAWRSSDTNSGDVYVRHFDPNGNALSADILVNSGNEKGNQGSPAIAINSDGSYVVAWQSDKGGSGRAIFAQRFTSLDAPIGTAFRVNTYDTNDQRRPTVATDGNGAFVIAWTSAGQDGDGDGVYAQLYGSDGSRVGSEFRVNAVTAKDQGFAAAAMDGAGNFIISWSSDKQDDGASTGVYAQRYSSAGAAMGSPFLVNGVIAGDQDIPAAAMNSGGDVVIAWEGNGTGDGSGIFRANYVASNTAPWVNPDAVSTDQNTPVNSAAPGPLANDIDPDAGSVLAVTGILAGTSGTPVTVTASGVTIIGMFGDLFIKSDGSYVYTPNSTTAKALAAGQSGDDVFTYVASDDKNATASSTLTFTVNGLNDAPVASDNKYAVDQLGTLNVAAGGVLSNDTDPDRTAVPDVLTVSAVNGQANKVGVLFAGTYGTLTLRADGSLQYAPDVVTVLLLGLLSGQSVVDNFTYSVSDGKGGTASAALQISIVGANSPPVATDDTGYAVQEDGVLTVAPSNGVLKNDTDPDGNALSAVLVSGPGNGSLIFNADGSFVYTPNALFYGADSFSYRASDGSLSDVASVSLTVTHINHVPVARSDSKAITQGGSLSIAAGNGLLSNDTDVDVTDMLAVTRIRAGNAVFPVAPASQRIVVTDYGTLTLGSDGSYSYMADGAASRSLAAGSISNDVFTYTVSDGQGGTSTATLTVTITGTNDAPTVIGAMANQATDDKASTTPFSGVTIDDEDSPAQSLAITITLDVRAKGTLSNLSGGTYDAANGIYSFAGSAAQATAAVRGLIFTPTANRVTPGTTDITTFTIAVNDGSATTTDATTTVVSTSINDVPAISGTVATQSVSDNAAVKPFKTVTVGDPDNPAQSLTVSITLDSAAKGSLSNLAGGTYDAATGTYTFTGSAAQATAALRGLLFIPGGNRAAPGTTEITTFTITLTDGLATATDASTTVASTSVNDAPVISGTVAAQQVADNAVLSPFSGVTFDDADKPAQSLKVSITLDSAAKGSLSNLGGGTYDAATGIYCFTGLAGQATAAVRGLIFAPTANRVGPGSTDTTTFTIAVCDGPVTATDASTTVVSTSINDAPVVLVASSGGMQDAAGGIVVTLVATDADGTAASFKVTSLPANGALYLDAAGTTPVVLGASISASDNALSLYFKPASGWTGDTGFSYSATDDLGLDSSNQAVVHVTVRPVIAEVVPVSGELLPGSPEKTAPPVFAEPLRPVTADLAQTSMPSTPSTPTTDTASAPGKNAPAASRPTNMDAVLTAPGDSTMAVNPELQGATTVFSSDVQQRRSGARLASAGEFASRVSDPAGSGALLGTAIAADFSSGFSSGFGTAEAASAATQSRTMAIALDQLRESIKSGEAAEQQVVGFSVAAGTTVSAGYVIWLLRGGVLATSLLSSLPAWRFVDPLPVLSRFKGDDKEDDDDNVDDSLEAIVDTDPEEQRADSDDETRTAQ